MLILFKHLYPCYDDSACLSVICQEDSEDKLRDLHKPTVKGKIKVFIMNAVMTSDMKYKASKATFC